MIFLFFIFLTIQGFASDNFEESFKNDFFISSKKIEIPEYPNAFNPSIIRWKNKILLSFRYVDSKSPRFSSIGLIFLDENFEIISKPFLLPLREKSSSIPSRCEDGRLIIINDKLYIIYNDNFTFSFRNELERRIYVAELEERDCFFVVKSKRYMKSPVEGIEKNWSPFNFENKLLFEYSLFPHKILSNKNVMIANTKSAIDWKWGILRGGTPALLFNDDEYLAFFHSSKKMKSVHSNEKEVKHYFMGAYTFSAKPPFALQKLSPFPIVGKDFYAKSAQLLSNSKVIFPGGYLFDENNIYVAYGRDDCEIWIATFDKAKLYASLIPLQP